MTALDEAGKNDACVVTVWTGSGEYYCSGNDWEALPKFCLRVLKRWQMIHGKYLSMLWDQCLFFYHRFSNHLFIHSCGLLKLHFSHHLWS